MLTSSSYSIDQRINRAVEARNREAARRLKYAILPWQQKSQQYQFFGANKKFVEDHTSKEKLLAGPAETGKTLAALYFLNWCAWNWEGAQLAIIRNVRQDLYGSALVTFHTKILPQTPIKNPKSPIVAYGGEKPEKYLYPNGSVIWVGGLDKPGGALSSERDIIYVVQAEEILETSRNKLLTRVTGRSGNMPFAQLIYDANPADPFHFFLRLRDAEVLSFYESRHQDNPLLYKVDPATGEITAELTEQGQITIATLDNLTGVDRDRLRDGLWVQASGLVYGDEWRDGPEDGNVTDQADYIRGGGQIFWGVDDGYSGQMDDKTGYFTADSHPRAFGVYQMRPNGDLNLIDESYKVKTLSDQHIDAFYNHCEKKKYPKPSYVAVDKSAAELKGRLHALGFYTRNSPSSVDESIKEHRRWMAKDKNKRRRFHVHTRCKHTRMEYRVYRFDNNGKIVKAFDHGPDRDRYTVWTLRHRY